MSNTKESHSVEPRPASPQPGSPTDSEQTLDGENQESPSPAPTGN